MIHPHTIEFCEKCINRGFSSKSGIICSLTEAPANFGSTCPKFEEDKKEALRITTIRENSVKSILQNETMGLSRIGITNPTVAGILIIAGSIAWSLIEYFYFDQIFYFPIFGVIFGLVALVNGISRQKKKDWNMKNNDSLLDDF